MCWSKIIPRTDIMSTEGRRSANPYKKRSPAAVIWEVLTTDLIHCRTFPFGPCIAALRRPSVSARVTDFLSPCYTSLFGFDTLAWGCLEGPKNWSAFSLCQRRQGSYICVFNFEANKLSLMMRGRNGDAVHACKCRVVCDVFSACRCRITELPRVIQYIVASLGLLQVLYFFLEEIAEDISTIQDGLFLDPLFQRQIG